MNILCHDQPGWITRVFYIISLSVESSVERYSSLDNVWEDIIERLAKHLSEIQTALYAWILIPNHYLHFEGGREPQYTYFR